VRISVGSNSEENIDVLKNVFKHAFPNGSKGTIRIKVHQVHEKEMVLEISDNGVGLSPDLDIGNPASLGLRLVRGLLEHQLQGSLDVAIEGGTAFILRWPLPDAPGMACVSGLPWPAPKCNEKPSDILRKQKCE
jgi:K+-sensing histidine kinase KdpD